MSEMSAMKMFCDIHNKLNDPTIRNIISKCLFDGSYTGIEKALCRYPGEQFYGWLEGNIPVAICGFRVFHDKLEICHIAVDEKYRHEGIGSKMIFALQNKYKLVVEAETDDGAVNFYRKCGFETTAFQKHNTRRWVCKLPI